MTAEKIEVRDNPEAGRLEVEIDGKVAFAQYRVTDEGIVFPHTLTPPELEGRGIGGALVKAGMHMAESRGLKVIPRCSFFADYIARHPEYEGLVHPDYQKR